MSRVERGFERLADVEGRFLAVAFFATLLVYTLALVSEALGYSEAARLFPLIVGVPLLAMLVVYILLLLLRDRIEFQTVGFFDDFGDMGVPTAEAEGSRAVRYRRELSMVGWVAALVLLTWLVGNLVAVFLFVFAFITAYEGRPGRALLVAGLTFAFIYLLFVQVLGATLWRGIVPLGGLLT